MAEDPVIDITKVSDKGQVVIPKEIREKVGFREGAKLIVVATEDAVVLQRIEAVAGKIRVRDLVARIKSVTSKLGLG
jgi:AbrB family looped-hinge helix DNA binding protein